MKILVVDDQPDLAESLALLLNEHGHECTPAVSAADALVLCKAMPFDILLTDYAMPGMSGLDLAGEVRRLYPVTAIVMFTAYGSTFYQREEREPQVDAVVQKPVTIVQLQAVFRRVTRRSRQAGTPAGRAAKNANEGADERQ